MIEAAIPQNILKYKTKFIAGFSVRECIFLVLMGATAALGIMKLFAGLEGTAKIYACAGLVTPIGVVGFVKPYGQPFEKIALQIVYDNFVCPLNRKKEIHYPTYEKFKLGLYKPELMELPMGEPEGISKLDAIFISEEPKRKSKKKSKKDTGKPQMAMKSKTYKGIR